MMMFRHVKDWIVDYLGRNASRNGFRVVGFNDSDIDASQLRGTSRLVQVFVRSGEMPAKSSPFVGPVVHDVSVAVELLTACASSVDLSVLESETATPAQIATALAASQKAAQLADEDFDELFEVVYRLLMANDVQDLGYPGEVSRRWSPSWKKAAPLNRGESVIIAGSIEFGFQVSESLTGLYPVTPTADGAIRVAINASANEGGTPQEGSAVLAGG